MYHRNKHYNALMLRKLNFSLQLGKIVLFEIICVLHIKKIYIEPVTSKLRGIVPRHA